MSRFATISCWQRFLEQGLVSQLKPLISYMELKGWGDVIKGIIFSAFVTGSIKSK